jgi:hypothetical protein
VEVVCANGRAEEDEYRSEEGGCDQEGDEEGK